MGLQTDRLQARSRIGSTGIHSWIAEKGITTVRDEIEYVYRRDLVWSLVGRLFVLGTAAALCLPRVESTRRLLE